jgi:acetate kinase
MKILVLNAGSSSQKSCLYEVTQVTDVSIEPLWESTVDWTHHPGVAEVKVKTSNGKTLQSDISSQSRLDVHAYLLDTLWQGETQVIESLNDIEVVGHRVVHGGQQYRQRVRITGEVKTTIAQLSALAPVHNPVNLEGIEAIEKALGDVLQIAVFDTAFHSQIPDAAAVYPVPQDWTNQGIRRYGFHGISHEYCAHRAAQLLQQDLADLRLIICHLGNGCSLSAVKNGHSVDTTMGFTPLDGLMMGTRSGSVDPGILLHQMRQNYTVEQLDQALNKASGLKGVSGVSGDMREVMAAIASGNAAAQLALDIYVHRLRSGIGSMLASLDGLDALIFTAGVGENSAPVRALTCEAFEWLGVKIDVVKNESHAVDENIAADDSTVKVLVIHTQEDWAIAQECYQYVESVNDDDNP